MRPNLTSASAFPEGNMSRKHLIRFSTLTAMLLAAFAHQQAVSAEGCGYTCEELSGIACVPETLQGCYQIAYAVCEDVLESAGPDCVRQCPVILAYCFETGDCSVGKVALSCLFDY